MRILIADNNWEYYYKLRDALALNRPAADQVEFVSTAAEAYDELKHAEPPYSLVILDEQNVDDVPIGSTVLRQLRDQPISYEPSIIYITAFFRDLPAGQIVSTGQRVTLFMDKESPSDELLYRAVSLVARQREGVHYQAADSLGEDFIALLEAEMAVVFDEELRCNLDLNQQRSIASLVRSFFATLKLRRHWVADDVLEMAVFLAEGLCRVYDLKDPIVNLVRKFFNIDEILYTIPRYRDHFLHQIKVFLLGYCILHKLNRSRRLDDTPLGARNAMKLWFMASVFHDIGYPFEKIQDWLDKFVLGVLKNSDEPESLTSLIPMEFHWGTLFARRYHWYHLERIANSLCSCYRPNDAKVRTELLVALAKHVAETPDHGLFSALILQNFLRVNVADCEVDPVVTAVSLHNWRVSRAVRSVLGCPLTFRRDPLSFLLMFCDTAQEWGRAEAALRDLKPASPGPTSFRGQAMFDGLSWDESKGLLNIDIRFSRTWARLDIDRWKTEIFDRELSSLNQTWAHANSLSFSISYFHGHEKGSRQPLDELHL